MSVASATGIVAATPTTAGPGGDWPHTNRLLPWGVAVFLCLLWLIPVNAMELSVSLPVEARPDRIFLAGLAFIWIAVWAAGGPLVPRWRSSAIHIAGFAFLVVVFISLLLGYQRAALDGSELDLATKRVALLASYVVFFLIVASTLRPVELPRFLALTVGLAAVAGAGTVVENLTGTNVFYTWSRAVLPMFDVPSAPSGTQSGRQIVVGPTQHGLAITTALSMVLPFAMIFVLRARSLLAQLLTIAAMVIIVAGCFATERKTGLLATAASASALILYRPREASKVVAMLIAATAGLAVLIPDAARSVYEQVFVDDVAGASSTQGRLSDYDAIRPDVLSNVLFGRGYGTYYPLRYRILDNELLGQLVNIGILGLLAFCAILIAGLIAAHAVARARGANSQLIGMGTVGAIAAFTLTTTTFDALSFVQVPYLLLLLLASVVVARDGSASLDRQ